jgi:hypothetical protein
MNPYSGLVELFEKKGLLSKDGNRLKYIDSKGEEHKEYRKNWTGELLDMVMSDYVNLSTEKVNIQEDTEEPIEEPVNG